MKKLLMVIPIFMLLFITYTFGYYYDSKDCRNETNGKRPGHVYLMDKTKVWNRDPIETYTNSTEHECIERCIKDLNCELVEHNKMLSICDLYHSFSSLISSPGHMVFRWEFCNLFNATEKKQGAPGFWFYTINSFRITYDYLINITADLRTCRKRCRKEELCGGFNFQGDFNICQLIVLWNHREYNVYSNIGYTTYFWVLQSNISYHLEKGEYCRNIKNKICRGLWKIVESESDDHSNIIVIFQTRNFSLCYKTCEYYTNCKEAVFYYYKSLCVLKPLYHRPCVEKAGIKSKEKLIVQWSCCSDEGQLTLSNSMTLQTKTARVGNCRLIRKERYVSLIPFQCTFPPISLSENCKSKHKVVSTNCFHKQALTSTEIIWKDYTKVFNGYQTFWLKNASIINFPIASLESCELYNASIPSDPSVNIINFKDIYPIDHYEILVKLSLPIKYVVVGTLPHSNCLCFERLHCIEVLRHAQIQKSLPFNFIIDAKADIFESKGWNYKAIFEGDFQAKLLYIGFLGNFSTNTPSIASVDAFKNLVAFGVQQRYIDSEYILLTDHEVYPKDHPNVPTIYNIIRMLPRYNNSIKVKCKELTKLTLIFNGILMVTFVLLLLLFSAILYKYGHSSGCILLRKTALNQRLSKTEIHNLTKDIELILKAIPQLKEFFLDIDEPLKINNSSFFWLNEKVNTSPCVHCAKKFQATLRLWGMKKKLINLKDLKKIPNFCRKGTLCLLFRAPSVLCKNIVVILHLRQKNFVEHFQSNLFSIISGRCVCLNYNISFLDTESKITNFKRISNF